MTGPRHTQVQRVVIPLEDQIEGIIDETSHSLGLQDVGEKKEVPQESRGVLQETGGTPVDGGRLHKPVIVTGRSPVSSGLTVEGPWTPVIGITGGGLPKRDDT